MAVRFLEYIKYRGRDISLYIVEECNESTGLSFRVNIRDGHGIIPVLMKKNNDVWSIITPEVPLLVTELEPVICALVQTRIKDDVPMSQLENCTSS